MRRLRTACALLTAAALMLSGAAGASAGWTPEQARIAGEFNETYADCLGLTAQQRLEDYDYLWDTLEDCFPDLNVARRMGVDTEAVRQQVRGEIEQTDSDMAFYKAVENTTYALGNVGHLALLSPAFRELIADNYRLIGSADPGFAAALAAWVDTLDNPRSVESYRKLSAPLEAYAEAWNAGTEAAAPREPQPNLTAKRLPGNVAYLKINQMLADFEQDREAVMEFYEQSADCPDLILDITGNGGGNYQYWQELIAAPNLSKPATYGGYLLYQDGANNRRFLSVFTELEGMTLEPVSLVPRQPDLPNINREDLLGADAYVKAFETIQPAGGKKAYDGRIWVLIGPNVYSSAEKFAAFCKQTGFATLVGERTGGDGFGMDPIYCVLPNSGLIVRYSMFAGLNPDGRNSEEFGTRPDIARKPGESPLDTCLRAITLSRSEDES